MLSADDLGSAFQLPQLEAVHSVPQQNSLPIYWAPDSWTSGIASPSALLSSDFSSRNHRVLTVVTGANFNRTETSPAAASPTNQWVRVLRTEMQQLQARTESEISRLSSAVESLARAVSAIGHPVQDEAEYLSKFAGPPKATSADTGSDEDLANTLNWLADADDNWTEDWCAVAKSNLDVADPVLRAAAARAIASHEGVRAETLLAARLETETNKFVRSVLRSALAVARA